MGTFTNGTGTSGKDSDRILIERLVAETRLYGTSDAVKELMEFTIKLRAFAPFNAMLIHIQKPGVTHAATAGDWKARFKRRPKREARPLVILRTMGPVDFVFDFLDTEGEELPANAFAFPTLGKVTEEQFASLIEVVSRSNIEMVECDWGDGYAGTIELVSRATRPSGKNRYRLHYNRNHSPSTRVVTVAHELAHLYLGHMGSEKGRRLRDRRFVGRHLKEVEAEMTAYLVAKRNDITAASQQYLDGYKHSFTDLNHYTVMRAANAVETVMGLSSATLWEKKKFDPLLPASDS